MGEGYSGKVQSMPLTGLCNAKRVDHQRLSFKLVPIDDDTFGYLHMDVAHPVEEQVGLGEDFFFDVHEVVLAAGYCSLDKTDLTRSVHSSGAHIFSSKCHHTPGEVSGGEIRWKPVSLTGKLPAESFTLMADFMTACRVLKEQKIPVV